MKCSIWIHDHEILYEFITWIQIWIHNMNSDMNSWSWKISWDDEFVSELISVNLCMNSSCSMHIWYIWIHIVIWIHIMNLSMNAVRRTISWIHGWMPMNEFTYEIMVEFINLKWIWIQLQICFRKGNKFYSSKVIMISPLQSAHCQLPALRLLHCCCSMATGLHCCNGRRRMLLCTAECCGLKGLDGQRWTALASRSAWLAYPQWMYLPAKL